MPGRNKSGHAAPGASRERDDLAEWPPLFSGLFVLRHPLMLASPPSGRSTGLAEVRAGVRQLVTQRGDSRRPIARKPAQCAAVLGISLASERGPERPS